jgi:hypothetical protein
MFRSGCRSTGVGLPTWSVKYGKVSRAVQAGDALGPGASRAACAGARDRREAASAARMWQAGGGTRGYAPVQRRRSGNGRALAAARSTGPRSSHVLAQLRARRAAGSSGTPRTAAIARTRATAVTGPNGQVRGIAGQHAQRSPFPPRLAAGMRTEALDHQIAPDLKAVCRARLGRHGTERVTPAGHERPARTPYAAATGVIHKIECPQLLSNSNRKKMFIRESVAGCRRRITVAYRYQNIFPLVRPVPLMRHRLG